MSSLYQLKNPLTATAYGGVNPTNSNPPPFTSTEDASFRGGHTVVPPPNPMKGGYGYSFPKNTKRSKARGKGRKKMTSSSWITLAPGLKFSSKTSRGGKGRKTHHRRRLSRQRRMSGMTLARGYAGGTQRRRRHRRRRGGNVGSSFPTGYGLPGTGSLNGVLANPPIPVLQYGT